MNVAKKSTTKLPQNWQHGGTVPAEGKDEEADSGVGSADSVDFQDALLNLKALNGASCSVSACESIQSNLCKENDHPAECEAETISADTSYLLREKNDEKDILEQIEDVVNDRSSRKVLSNGTSFDKVAASKVDQETEEDDILILSPDGSETKRELKLLETSALKGKGVSGNGANLKNSLKIGEKVRSKVHTIMSKFVQNNPVVNNLLTKAKSVHSEDSDGPGGGSSPASPSVFRQDKGNLFDNFEVTDTKLPVSAFSNCQLLATASHNTESSSLPNLPKEADEDPSVESAMAEPPPESCNSSHMHEGNASSVTERTESKPNSAELGQDSDIPLDSNTQTVDTESRPDFTVESNFKLESKVTESETDKEAKCEIAAKCETEITAKCENAHTAKCDGDTASIVTGPSIADCCQGNGELTVAQTASQDAVQEESMDTSKLVKSDKNTCDQLTKNVIGDDVETSLNGQVTERKRQHSQDAVVSDSGDSYSGDSNDSSPQVAKRSRLDGLIGKLGERVSFTSETPENDAFEDDDSTPGDTDSVEKQSEELISCSASDEEEEKTPSTDSVAKIVLTKKELEKLIIHKVTAAVQQYQSQEILQLNRRIEELVQSSEEWRSKAKELQSQMLELTILQQKLDKRKAHTAALKSITTRSIGVGVTEDRLRTTTPQKASGTKTPPATPPAVSQAPPTFTSSQRLPAPAAAQSVAARNTSVAHLLSQTAHMPTVASCQAAAAKAAVGKPIDSSGRLVGGLPQNHNSIFRGQSLTTLPASNMVLVNSATGLPVVTSSAAQSVSVATRVASASSRDLIDLTVEDEANATKQAGKQEQYVLLWDTSQTPPGRLLLPSHTGRLQFNNSLLKPLHREIADSSAGLKPRLPETLPLIRPQPAVQGLDQGSEDKSVGLAPIRLLLPKPSPAVTGQKSQTQSLANPGACAYAQSNTDSSGQESSGCSSTIKRSLQPLCIVLPRPGSSRDSSTCDDAPDEEDKLISDENDSTQSLKEHKLYMVLPETDVTNSEVRSVGKDHGLKKAVKKRALANEDSYEDDDDDDDDDDEDETGSQDSGKLCMVFGHADDTNGGKRVKVGRRKSGVEKKNKCRHNEPLNQQAVSIMNEWYCQNLLNPYPTHEDKEWMAREGGLTVGQVKSWFANKRNRTNTTRPKVQKRAMEQKLLQLYAQVAATTHEEAGGTGIEIINQLSQIINPIINTS